MTINDPRDDPQYRVGDKNYKPKIDRTTPVADPQTVAKFHEKADTDAGADSLHHTLGPRNGQSSPGDHNHNGKNSRKLLAGTTLTGAKTGNPAPALASVIAALVKLGATDSTTA